MMSKPTFEQLPDSVAEILSRIQQIEKVLKSADLAPTKNEETLTAVQAAEFLHLKLPTLYKKARCGIIPCIKPHKQLIFFRSELEEYFKSHRKPSIGDFSKRASDTVNQRLTGIKSKIK